jgi:hypothetical protein
MMRVLFVCLLLVSIVAASSPAGADEPSGSERLEIQFGPYMQHFSYDPRHNSYPWYVGVEWESKERLEVGGSFFMNSYDQPSGYVYGGKRFISGSKEEHFFVKITMGLLLGYVKPYDQKIPVNWNGVGIGIIPAVGYKYQRSSVQCALLGISAVMFLVGYDVWD